jgi:GH15 family glucan-1,4-alpha-glucosidase
MFTQVTYASGLNAARLIAEAMGDASHAQGWRDAGKRILDAIHRPASAQPCPGLWNDAESHWNRGVFPDCTVDDRLDASTDLSWVFGLVDAFDQRIDTHREAVLSELTPGADDLGIARYEGDEFYHENPFSPGGTLEASAALASWPQMDMYMAMLEHWRGLDDLALQRLSWYARVTNVGYMPPGEGVDWQSDRPLPSTASEPVTAAWYNLALLNFLNLFDPRLPPFEPASAPAPAPEP